jgi:hypothetical protein
MAFTSGATRVLAVADATTTNTTVPIIDRAVFFGHFFSAIAPPAILTAPAARNGISGRIIGHRPAKRLTSERTNRNVTAPTSHLLLKKARIRSIIYPLDVVLTQRETDKEKEYPCCEHKEHSIHQSLITRATLRGGILRADRLT